MSKLFFCITRLFEYKFISLYYKIMNKWLCAVKKVVFNYIEL